MTDSITAVDEFKAALASLEPELVLDRYYYGRTAAMIASDREAELRRAIASKFGISMTEVLVTGSAKLGFTVVPKPEADRPRFSPFSDASDIDVAIVSQPLFVSLWEEVAAYQREHSSWSDIGSFRKYLMRGWLRPDYFPKDVNFPRRREWFEFFRELQSRGLCGHYQVSAGVYFNASFFEKYALKSLIECKQDLEAGL